MLSRGVIVRGGRFASITAIDNRRLLITRTSDQRETLFPSDPTLSRRALKPSRGVTIFSPFFSSAFPLFFSRSPRVWISMEKRPANASFIGGPSTSKPPFIAMHNAWKIDFTGSMDSRRRVLMHHGIYTRWICIFREMSPRKGNRDKERECVREDRASIGRILSATRVKKLGNDLGILFFFSSFFISRDKRIDPLAWNDELIRRWKIL